MSSYREIDAFKKVVKPETEKAEEVINNVLESFNKLVKIECKNKCINFDDGSVSQCLNNTVKEYIKNILDEGKKFCELTRKSVKGSNEIAQHCSVIISYVETLMNERVSGMDFQDALKDLLQTAHKCKDETTKLKDGYTNINNNMRDIAMELDTINSQINEMMEKEEQNANLQNQEKKLANRAKWACIVTSTGLTILSPALAGVPLIGAGILGYVAKEKAEDVKECRVSRDQSRSLVESFKKINSSIDDVAKETESIINILDCFKVFWDRRVDEIDGLINDFENKKDSNVGYNKLTGKAVIKSWTEVQDKYSQYSNIILSLLNNSSVNRRLEMKN
ncbi:hypothetical protein RclHR1_06130001 [Rhizophagus clarus]|uniref:Uncharacterized protein n=1 Tax=Rhizophagus clarus TaxID=94130 RepID=A0A2Z6S7L8_9GLOM|nr:hypothetical protein RclHR1_06130001 [Rhizophagus clarus]GES73319.1 hypothetical protein GLOIN_2v1133213 [Rhizophagus clarus]